MAFSLPELPYPKNALEPHISAETFDYHHGKHHKAYVDKLNKGIEGTEYADMKLEDIILKSTGGLFNNAAQTWNHTFFWNCMGPNKGAAPSGPIASEIDSTFGSFDQFKEEFSEKAAGNFGSGWTWLVKNKAGKLEIINTDDAKNPMTEGHTPLLTLDVWEHAYYIDYRNARPKFIEAFWNIVNWDFVAQNFEQA